MLSAKTPTNVIKLTLCKTRGGRINTGDCIESENISVIDIVLNIISNIKTARREQ